MIAEAFDYQKHAALVTSWGKKHNFPLLPKEFLPNIGFMVGDTACGFLYSTNSAMGWVEWVFTNPEKSKEERKEAINMLFDLIEVAAQELKVKALFSAAANPAYAQILKRHGFEKTDENVIHFVKNLGGI